MLGFALLEDIQWIKKIKVYLIFLHHISFGSSGKEDDVKYHSIQIGALYNVLDNTSLQLSIPYNIQSGPLGDVNGIGDLIISVNQNLFSDENNSLVAYNRS